MQSDLFRADAEAMLDRTGVQPGWRCLDLCCGVGGITDLMSRRVGLSGEVVGLDSDPQKLEVARAWAKARHLGNVRFVEGDLFDTGLAPASFDLVHTRFALSVIPGGAKALEHLLSLVQPGGVVFLQEADVTTLDCQPGHPAWDRAVGAIVKVFDGIGADVTLGGKLFAKLQAAGLQELKICSCVHRLRAGEPMMLHIPATLEAMRESVLSMNLMSGPEMDEVIAELQEHLARPETLKTCYAMVQVSGRVPV